jgi:uncharacterized damage-inducible protein DinB
MNAEWFIAKFEFDFEANANWADYLAEIDDPDQELIRVFSHIINVHHIWIRRIIGKQIESNEWDSLDPRYFSRLNNQNFQETLDYLETLVDEQLIHYKDASGKIHEDLTDNLLYHILHHSAHHRGQLSLLAQQLKLDNRPALNFVGWRQK